MATLQDIFTYHPDTFYPIPTVSGEMKGRPGVRWKVEWAPATVGKGVDHRPTRFPLSSGPKSPQTTEKQVDDDKGELLHP